MAPHIICVLEGMGKFLCVPGIGNGGVEGAGGNLRTRQRGSAWPSGPDHGLKQCLPTNHPKWPAAISPWKNRPAISQQRPVRI